MVNKNLSESREHKFVSKNSHGITLIALVVTVVVLIILATVSIIAVLGDNGIIARAERARNMHETGRQDEENTLDNYAEYMGNYLDGKGGSSGGDSTQKNPVAGTIVAKPEKWTNTNVTPIADGKGGTLPLPNEFYYVGGDISTGIVISDKQGDTMNASGVNMGNQFVWIPVSGEDDLTRTNFDENGNPTTEVASAVKEPYTKGYDTEVEEYNTMKTQVLKYGGFYIGRYEAGVNSTTLRTKVTTNQTVVCKKGVAPYNYVPWGKKMYDADTAFVPTTFNEDSASTNGMVYLAKNMYSSSNSVTSTLTYGCQWDAMCRYIGDSQRTTPTKSAPELTGSVGTDVSKNIYDLAGNCYESTMETGDDEYRITRGSCYDEENMISDRSFSSSTTLYDSFSFRPTLYIK